MITTVLTHPKQTAFTTLDRLKAQLGISASTDDLTYSSLIAPASDQVREIIGYEGARREVQDRFRGSGFGVIQLSDGPIAALGTIQYDGSTVDPGTYDISIESSRAGTIRRSGGFQSSVFEQGRGWELTDRPLWTAEYWAGWLLPDDDFSSSSITFANTGQTLTLSTGTWPYLVAGDRITLSGASNAENSGTFTVSARTSDTVLTLDSGSGIVDEAEGSTISAIVCNIPASIERATILCARDFFLNRSGPIGAITDEKAGPLQTSYGNLRSSNIKVGGVSAEAISILSRYRRVR